MRSVIPTDTPAGTRSVTAPRCSANDAPAARSSASRMAISTAALAIGWPSNTASRGPTSSAPTSPRSNSSGREEVGDDVLGAVDVLGGVARLGHRHALAPPGDAPSRRPSPRRGRGGRRGRARSRTTCGTACAAASPPGAARSRSDRTAATVRRSLEPSGPSAARESPATPVRASPACRGGGRRDGRGHRRPPTAPPASIRSCPTRRRPWRRAG